MRNDRKTLAHVAGLAYLGLIATGVFNLVYVPSQVIVQDDPVATLEKLSASEGLFRWGIVSGYACYLLFLILPVLLYRVFESQGRIASALMAAFAIVSVPISFVALAHHVEIADLIAAGGGDRGQTAQAIGAELDAYRRLTSVAEIFWGLWLFPLAYLILKSGAIPRLLGAWLILEGALYLAGFFGPDLSASYDGAAIPGFVKITASLGEIGVCVWLLAMGVRVDRSA